MEIKKGNKMENKHIATDSEVMDILKTVTAQYGETLEKLAQGEKGKNSKTVARQD